MNIREPNENVDPAGGIPPLPASHRVISAGIAQDVSKETILLAEDDSFIRAAVHQTLEFAGYKVLSAESAAGAKQMYRSHPEWVDLLLADIVMPGMSGRELARELLVACPGLRVLLMSGYSQSLKASDPYGEDYMVKPFSMATLLQRVRQALDEDRSVRGVAAQTAQRLT